MNTFYLFLVFGLIARLFPFVILPIIISTATDQEVGSFLMYISVTSFLSALFVFGTQFELTRVFFHKNNEVGSLTINAGFLILTLGLLCISILYLMKVEEIYFLASINGLFSALIIYALVYYRISGAIVKFGLVDILRIAFPYIAFLFLLFSTHHSISLVLVANVAWILLLLIFEFINNGKNSFFKLEVKKVKVLATKGVKIVPHYISLFGLMILDKIIIKEFSNDVVLAQYSAGFLLGQIVLLVSDAFNKVWSPYVVKGLKNGRGRIIKAQTVKIFALVVFISPFFSVFVYYCSNYYFPADYDLARKVAAIVSFVFITQVSYFLVFPYMISQDLVYRMGLISTVSTLLGSIVMLLLAYLELYYLLPLGVFCAFSCQVVGMLLVLFRNAV